MYKHIAVIGVGSLGGYIAECLMSLDTLEELVIIDDDVVVRKNVYNSIYRERDVGELKIDALKKCLQSVNDNIRITGINQKFVENYSQLPSLCDLVIDCRDYVYNRGTLIDIQASISGRYLIVDCRKNITYPTNYSGGYNSLLKRTDLKHAALQLTRFIDSGAVTHWIENQEIFEFNLDHHIEEAGRALHQQNSSTDYIYEIDEDDSRFLKLEKSILHILDTNQTKEVQVYLGDQKTYIGRKVISKGKLKNAQDVFSCLRSVAGLYPFERDFVINVEGDIIQLLFVTGGA